jgi:hypothetical protein
MYEPKYKLNKKDVARWHALLLRHCLEAPVLTSYQRRLRKKYPPLTPAESLEFEALCRKRSKKIEAHPAVKASLRRSKRRIRIMDKLSAKLKILLK